MYLHGGIKRSPTCLAVLICTCASKQNTRSLSRLRLIKYNTKYQPHYRMLFLRPVSHEGCIWANHNTEGPKIIYCVPSASSVFASEFPSFGRTPTAESCAHNCSPKVAETNIPGDNHNVHNITALMSNCLTFSCHPVWAHKVTNAAHTARKRSTDPPKTAEAVLSSGRL